MTTAPALPSRALQASAARPPAHRCDLCGADMYEHSCKIVCPNCGYKRDCSDP